MLQRFFPVNVGIAVHEMIVVMLPVRFRQVVAELAVGHWRHFLAGIHAGLIQGYRVKGSEHADVGQNRRIVVAVTVAVGRNIHGQIDVEAGTVLGNCPGILCHLAVQLVSGVPLVVTDGIEGAGTDAAAAALADILVDMGLVVYIGDGIGAAFLGAATAAPAQRFIHDAFPGRMLFHFTGAAAAAHADILQRAAKTCHFMTFKMGQTDKHVRIHDSASDFRFFHIHAVLNRNLCFVRAPQTVSNNDLAAGCSGIETVQVRAVHMLQRMPAAAWIEGIAVCQERNPALFLHQIGNHLRVLGTQERHVAQFAEMHFDSDKLAFHIDLLNACHKAERFQLLQQAYANLYPEIRKIHL